MKGLDHRTGGHRALGQDHADALCSFQQLDHDGRAIQSVHALRNVIGLPREHRRRHADIVPADQLQRTQLVPRTGDGLRFIQAVDPHHLQLSNHRHAKERDRRSDTRDHRVDRTNRFALVEQLRVALADADIELQRVQHAHAVAALPSRLRQHARAVQGFIP